MKVFLITAIGFVIAACGPAPSQELPGEYGAILATETDCETLQSIFDTAESASNARRDAGDLDAAKGFTAVMTAADERMATVGCYG